MRCLSFYFFARIWRKQTQSWDKIGSSKGNPCCSLRQSNTVHHHRGILVALWGKGFKSTFVVRSFRPSHSFVMAGTLLWSSLPWLHWKKGHSTNRVGELNSLKYILRKYFLPLQLFGCLPKASMGIPPVFGSHHPEMSCPTSYCEKPTNLLEASGDHRSLFDLHLKILELIIQMSRLMS